MEGTRKIVNIIILIGCLGFIFLGFYIYIHKGAPLQLLTLIILVFGTSTIISIISLMSKRESWAIDVKKITKRQSVVLGICGIIFSICSFWVALVLHTHIIIKLILLMGSVLFGKWGIDLLAKRMKGPHKK